MEIQRPFAPEAPQPPVVCPSPQPDGVPMAEGCMRLTAPESKAAKQLSSMLPCQELGHCARAQVVRLLLQRAAVRVEEESEPEPPQAMCW